MATYTVRVRMYPRFMDYEFTIEADTEQEAKDIAQYEDIWEYDYEHLGAGFPDSDNEIDVLSIYAKEREMF